MFFRRRKALYIDLTDSRMASIFKIGVCVGRGAAARRRAGRFCLTCPTGAGKTHRVWEEQICHLCRSPVRKSRRFYQ